MRTIQRAGPIAILFLALPIALSGQEEESQEAPQETRRPAQLVGQVVNASTGLPIEGAVVASLASGFGGITDSTGNFRIPQVYAGTDTLEVRYIGYEVSSTEVTLEANETTRVTLLLSQTVVRVADLTVEVRRDRRSLKLAGFLERREKGFGMFWTPRDIRARNPRLPSDLLRGLPGVHVGRIEHGVAEVYVGRNVRRDCPPAVYVDGVYQSGLQVDDIPREELGAVELYRGASDTPMEYMRTAGRTCGAILIWTPDGPEFFTNWDPGRS
jgi:hypothetical protein